MKILNFTATEILPALLDKSKTQTIRPASIKTQCAYCKKKGYFGDFKWLDSTPDGKWVYCNKNCWDEHEKQTGLFRRFINCNGEAYGWRELTKKDCYLFDKPARFKVGDKVQLGWKVRGTPKDAVFCSECGGFFSVKDGHMRCITEKYKGLFSKLLGTATITEVFQIEMRKTENPITSSNVEERPEIYVVDVEDKNADYDGRYCAYDLLELAKADGFKTIKEFSDWFNKRYDLSNPKKFHVYKWFWNVD